MRLRPPWRGLDDGLEPGDLGAGGGGNCADDSLRISEAIGGRYRTAEARDAAEGRQRVSSEFASVFHCSQPPIQSLSCCLTTAASHLWRSPWQPGSARAARPRAHPSMQPARPPGAAGTEPSSCIYGFAFGFLIMGFRVPFSQPQALS